MALTRELIAAYEKAEYVLFFEPELIFKVGVRNAELDELLEDAGATTAAFVSAANPAGALFGRDENRMANVALMESQDAAGYSCFEGEGRDPEGEWDAEPSTLVVGIPRTEAEELGRVFEQNAIVFIEKGRAPELVLLRRP